jgi:hypothetical protein
MKKVIGRGALALTMMLAASIAPTALAADHLDGPSVKADATSDLTDVFTWVDGANTILILNVNPSATTATKFSNTVQYVFHTSSQAKYGAPSPMELDIMCTFDATQKISCWVGTDDYLTGDASAMGGLKSASGDTTVFAGLRDDPFFFNLSGFHDAEADVEMNASTLTFGVDGCPAVSAAISSALVADISKNAHGAMPATDFFAPSASYSGNVLSIVLSVKTSVLTAGGPILGVWASTNKGS